MPLDVVRLRPGCTATRWLIGRIHELQAGDPLHAVTVAVPANHVGLHLRRVVAAEGYANVRFTTLGRLAETLGAGRLAQDGAAPLQRVTRSALVRAALRGAGGALAEGADHPGLVDLVGRLAAELRRRSDLEEDRRRIRASGTGLTHAVIDAIDAYESRRAVARLYDEVDVRHAAAAVAASPAPTVGATLADLGDLIVHLPERIDPPDVALLGALTERTRVIVAIPAMGTGDALAAALATQDVPTVEPVDAPAAIEVLLAPDPVEEVRAAVRAALAAAEAMNIPLHRMAIVHADDRTYAGLLRDTLDEAGIPQVALDGRPLAEAAAARALLGLVRLRDQRFARAAVLAWVSTAPAAGGAASDGGVLTNQSRWDKLSRDAGVVRGAGQWHDLLTAYAAAREETLRGLDGGVEDAALEARRRRVLRDVEDARAIAEHVAAIDAATGPPDVPTWEAHVSWALRLRTEFITPDHAWSAEDREALQAVDETITGLVAAHDLEPVVSLSTFLRALEDGLRARHRPVGRMGTGIITGPHRLLLGLDLARVHILGVVEGAVPSSPAVDPLLAGDPLGRQPEREVRDRRDWLAALATADGGGVLLSAPAEDIDGRAVYPSPWLLEALAEAGSHPRASEVRSGTVTHPRLRRIASVDDGLMSGTLLSVAERREAAALSAWRTGHSLAGSAVARRDDLPLHRALAVTQARRSSALTEFDGDVAAASGADIVAQGLTGYPQSATGVQTWASCPFRYLLGRVLAVVATEDVDDDRWWRIDAAERGSLVHNILEAFFQEVRTSGSPAPGAPYLDEHIRRIDALAEAEFAAAQRRGVTGHALVWTIERAAILADLRTLLLHDAKQREAGWRPAFLEQPFGIDARADSWPMVEVALGDGRAVALRGFIDRVDLDGNGGARVIDYKTGKVQKDPYKVETRFGAGTYLQLPIYGRAVRDRARAAGKPPPSTTSLYWYATLRGTFEQRSLIVDDAAETTLTEVLRTIDDGVRAGCFPQLPGKYDEHWGEFANCSWCSYTTLCPGSRGDLAAAKAGSPQLALHRALQPPDSGDAS